MYFQSTWRYSCADLLDWNLLNADSSESEQEGFAHALNVAVQLLIANVVAQISRVEGHIKHNLERDRERERHVLYESTV